MSFYCKLQKKETKFQNKIYHYVMNKSIITDQIHPDLETALDLIAGAGYEYVDIHSVNGKTIEDCTKEEAKAVKSALDAHGLKCACLASTIFFMCPLNEEDEISLFKSEFKVTQGDVNAHLAALTRACANADILECENIRVFPFRFPDNKTNETTPEEMDKIVACLSDAEKIASAHHKTLVLENCPYSRCPKGEMTTELVKRVNDPGLRLLWDPANSYRAVKKQVPDKYLTKSLLEEKEIVMPYLGHLHAKSYHETPEKFVHKPLLEGDLDWPVLFDGIGVVCSLEPELEPEEAIGDMKTFSSL